MSIEHEKFDIYNDYGRKGPYHVVSNSLVLKSNDLDVNRPLNIEIGTDFEKVMKRRKVKANKSYIMNLEPDEIIYLAGDENSRSSVYLEGLHNRYIVVCAFDLGKKGEFEQDGSIVFTFDSNDKLISISYVYTVTNLTPSEDFIYDALFGDLDFSYNIGMKSYSSGRFMESISELFPNDDFVWDTFTNPDGITGGIVLSNDKLSTLYEYQIDREVPTTIAIRFLSNEYGQ